MNIKMPPTALSGQFRMVVSEDAAGERVKHDTGFFDNLITDVGMNRVGTILTGGTGGSRDSFRALCGRFVVGSGSTTPAFTDTALVAPVAFATSDVNLSSESSNYTRGWYEITVSHQFGQGQAAGNLSEIGIQHTNASGPLWSRALILDGAGNPTTITVLADDFLTCYYTLRIMIPQEDAVFNIDVDYDEDGIVPTVVTARPLNTSSSIPARGWGLDTGGANNWHRNQFYTGGLADPSSENPLGGGIGSYYSQASFPPYEHGTYQRFCTHNYSLTEQNSDNLRTLRFDSLMGTWQINFNPPLQKNNTQTMRFTFGYSWARV